jgi:threonine/homoserine/homoserine lactone efflux protein
MDVHYLLKGIVLGFSIAAPVGPIGVLCIRKTLADGKLAGFITGLGAASADGIYGFLAAFGLTSVTSFLVGGRFWIQMIGGIFLLYLGAKTFMARSPEHAITTTTNRGLFRSYISTFALTLTNPMTILSFVAVFAGLGLVNEARSYVSATMLVLGVAAGSALWWLCLSGTVGLVKHKFTARSLIWANRIAGIIIIGFGVFAITSQL